LGLSDGRYTALATRADLLLLDEPTSGLDPLMEMAFRLSVQEARERGQTVFLSSHILSEVEAVCDRVLFLSRGKIVLEGDPKTLPQLHGAETLDDLFVSVAHETLDEGRAR